MLAFSNLFIVAAFAFSVNAVAVEKRSISETVQTCINSMADANNQLDAVTAAVSAFTSSDSYIGSNRIHALQYELESRLSKASVGCCVKYPAATPEEADALYTVVNSFVPKTKNALTQLQIKKPEFDKVFMATRTVETGIKHMISTTEYLTSCFKTKSPLKLFSYSDPTNALFSQLDPAFVDAKAKYLIDPNYN